MNGLRIVALTALVAIGLWTHHLFACDCKPSGPPLEEMKRAGAVFQGKVLKIDNDAVSPALLNVTIEVKRWWKGGDAAMVVVNTIKSGAACGYGFRVGSEYLVYTSPGQGPMHVSLCSRTRTLEAAQTGGDFKDLGEGVRPK